jgi:C-terminal processing protease CtpA/Prc
MISTERGPAIHTVKEECGLASYVAPGDLIVELDGVDTQSCTAEEVMEMMMNRREYTRKLTVVSTKDTW